MVLIINMKPEGAQLGVALHLEPDQLKIALYRLNEQDGDDVSVL